MPELLSLTDSQIAVYRPWAWIQIGEGNNAIRINYPEGPDQKFRWLKEFRWQVGMGNQGASVEFTIVEDRAGWNVIWPGILKRSAGGNTAEGQKVTCQWGYAGRRTDGSSVGSFPGSRGAYASAVHDLFITRMDMEYAEGAVNFRFSGTDKFSPTQSICKFDSVQDVTFPEAVLSLIEDLKQPSGPLPNNFTADFDSDPNFRKYFDLDQRRRWTCNGFPFLMTIQKWTTELRSKENHNFKDNKKVGPCIIPDTRLGQERLVFKASAHESYSPFLEIHVNPPEQGPLGVGRHTALSIRPDFLGNQLWAIFPQTINQGKLFRTIAHNENQGQELEQVQQGVPAEVASPALDDALTSEQKVETLRSTAIGTAGNTGSLYVPIKLEVELLGIPNMDSLDYLGKCVDLFLWNTSYIDDDLKWKREARIPSEASSFFPDAETNQSFGLFDPRFSAKYIITGISQNISSEGSFTTTLQLAPMPKNINDNGGN